MANPTDWRLFGQEKYLSQVSLHFKRYTAPRASWDHDHCSFCTAKFSETIPGALTEGYATLDDYHWICTPCYNDFKDQFGWTIANK